MSASVYTPPSLFPAGPGEYPTLPADVAASVDEAWEIKRSSGSMVFVDVELDGQTYYGGYGDTLADAEQVAERVADRIGAPVKAQFSTRKDS